MFFLFCFLSRSKDTSIKNEELILRAKDQICFFSKYEWDALTAD